MKNSAIDTKIIHYIIMYRVVEGMQPANILSIFFSPKDQTTGPAKTLPGCVTANVVKRSATKNPRCFVVPTAHADQFRNSFFLRTVNESQVQTEEFSLLSCGPHSQ